ncbi:MAG: hypothetical protein K8J08_07545, partial [Thermoanaerobaculia bacterium]|nr:hypothetical protein [Thermoanaerobaculia bacterium]
PAATAPSPKAPFSPQAGLALPILAVALLFLVASAASSQVAVVMGFTRQFNFPPTTGPNLHWISLPWVYEPVDVGTIGTLDAEDLCQDLGGVAAVGSILRWNEASSTFTEYACGAGGPFALVEGTAYAVRNAPGATLLGAVAGVHDNSFTYSIAPSGGSQLSWLSVPYHLRIPERHGDLLVTAEDLCRQIGSTEILAIVRWDEPSAAYQAYGCGSELDAPFEIERSTAYGVVNRAGQTITWQPIHY